MTSEFIVESIDPNDHTWQFLKDVSLASGIPKKFTSLATNATIFRWKFGDGHEIETTINPYIHTYSHSGTYSVSHQSCYPCIPTNSLKCSNGWCTKSISVQTPSGKGDFAALAAMGFMFFIFIKSDKCNEYKKQDRCLKDKDCTWQENKCYTRKKKPSSPVKS